MSTPESSEVERPWWKQLVEGRRVPLGFVKIDRKGSTEDWEQLEEPVVLSRRAAFAKAVEDGARQHGAALPLHWQGDGVMLFFTAKAETPAPVVAYRAARAIWERVRIDLNMSLRIAVHGARVPWRIDTGQLAHPAIDRCGHLEHVTPANGIAVSDDVYWLLDDETREQLAPLGVTRRDGTVAYLFPAKTVAKRDATQFDEKRDRELAVTHALRRATLTSPEVRRLRYVGFRLQRRAPPSLDLLDVFTPLHVEADASDNAAIMAVLSHPRFDKQGADVPPQAFFRPRSVAKRAFTDAFTGSPIVILGDPGSGKTTLLKWIAIQAARGSFVIAEKFGIERRWLPLLVSVGRLAEWRRINPSASLVEGIVGYVAERLQLQRDELRPLVEGCLEAKECLLLLDGLDETDRDERREMVSWIEGFAARHPGNTIVMTSRRVGFVPIEITGIHTVTLGNLDDDGVASYVRAFHRAYLRWENGDGASVDVEAEQQSRDLLGTLQESPRLAALSTNPFLLSAIALIHRSEGTLPRHRVLLYEVFARALCETWSSARRLVAGQGEAAIPYETEALPILGRLALAMHEQYPSGVAPEEFVVATLADALSEQSGLANEDARSAARAFLQKAGEDVQILYERGPGMWAFLHLTFQEFFAAAGLHALEKFEDTVRAKLFDPRWDEVIRLGVGYMALVQKRPEATRRLIEMVRGAVDDERPWVTEVVKLQIAKAALLAAEAGDALPASLRDKIADEFIDWSGDDLQRVQPLLRELANTEFGDMLGARWFERRPPDKRRMAADAAAALRSRRAEEQLLQYCETNKYVLAVSSPRFQARMRELVREGSDADARWAAVFSLWPSEENDRVLCAVATSDPERRVRFGAVWLLRYIESSDLRDDVQSTIARVAEQDSDEWVRANATLVRATGEAEWKTLAAGIEQGGFLLAWRVLSELSEIDADVRQTLRAHAMSASRTDDDTQSVMAKSYLAGKPSGAVARSLLRIVHPVFRCSPIMVAGTEELWVAPLVRLLADEQYAAGASDMLVRLAADNTLPAVRRLLTSRNPDARRNAATTAAALGADTSEVLLEALGQDLNDEQRKRVVNSLYYIATR